MSVDRHDDDFVATLDRDRPLLRGTAYLLLDDPRTADTVLDSVLAHLYQRGTPASELRLEALRGLVREDARPAPLPWTGSPKFELVDGPVTATRDPIVADLARLDRDQRAVIVLERFTQLPSVQIADLLDRPVDEVLVLARQARVTLASGHADRYDDITLARELRAAVPVERAGPRAAADDLADGRRLIRRRRLSRGSIAVAAVAVAVIVVSQLWPRQPSVPQAVSPPVPTTSVSARAACDTSDAACRTTILAQWRGEMAQVVMSHLDPAGSYFSGHSFYYDERYETRGFWSGQGGALAFTMFRESHGATEVYVQLATSRSEAIRCGQTTNSKCMVMRFMDGNRFTVSENTQMKDGLEVQYAPIDQVITVVARNTMRGEELHLEWSQLIELVQDERLRLPNY